MTIYKDLLLDTLDRAVERFEAAFVGISLEEANRFPLAEQVPSLKSLTWLAWHTARELDLQTSHLAGHQPIYISQGWTSRFDLAVDDWEDGWNHSLDQAQAIQSSDNQLTLDYLKAATQLTKTYIRDLDPASMEDIIDTNWTPAVTRGVRLISIIDDAIMHSGQAVYARRLLGK